MIRANTPRDLRSSLTASTVTVKLSVHKAPGKTPRDSVRPMHSAMLTGRDLRAERVRRGLTQAQLADLVGVSRQRITAAEAQYRVARLFGQRVLDALASLPAEAA